MRRFAGLALIAVAVLALSGRADAKADAFELTVTPDSSGSTHAVVVTAKTPSADLIGPQTLNVFLRSDLDDQYRPLAGRSGIQVQLEQIDSQTARATVALPAEGEWIVLPFADLTASDFSPLQSADQYPIVSFSIPWSGSSTRIRASKSSNPWPAIGAVSGGAIVAGLVALALFRTLDRRRPSSAVVVGTDGPA
jgi:hypothetical protein